VLQSVLRAEPRSKDEPAKPVSGGAPVKPEAMDARRSLEYNLEQLPYELAGAFDAVVRLELAQAATVEMALAQGALVPGQVRCLDSQARYPMGFAVDQFYDTTCRAQNAACWYVSRLCRVPLPKSMHKTIQALDRPSTRARIPDRVCELLSDYWRKAGYRNKCYRDLAEHHTVISSDARVSLDENGAPQVYLTIPSNPDVKDHGLALLTYDNPILHAYPTVMRVFIALFAFVDELCRLLVPANASAVQSIGMAFKGPITLQTMLTGYPSPQPGKFVHDFAQWKVAHLGPH
jgi:hypothetical protein